MRNVNSYRIMKFMVPLPDNLASVFGITENA